MNQPSKPPATLTLFHRHGDDKGVWPLAGKNTYRLGREAKNDVVLPFSWVSRRHAMIQVEENGRHNLIDLGSANGTFVNGRQIYTPTRLDTGDKIGIGKTVLEFFQESAPLTKGMGADSGADERTVAFVQKETVTILICDIHDYTRLSEVLGDQRISELLRQWTGKVSSIVREHDGMVDKFIGDAVMALWPGPDPRRNIRQALKTALGISLFTGKLHEKAPEISSPLRIGAALNTGEAMVGNIGVDGQRDFTVIGDVVNVAFRLEEKTSTEEGLDLVMGPEAAAHLADMEQYFSARTLTMKGKKEPVQAFVCNFRQLNDYLRRHALSGRA